MVRLGSDGDADIENWVSPADIVLRSGYVNEIWDRQVLGLIYSFIGRLVVYPGYDNRANEGRSPRWVEGASVLKVKCRRVN